MTKSNPKVYRIFSSIVIIILVIPILTNNYLFYNIGNSELFSRDRDENVMNEDYLKTSKISETIYIW